MTEVGYALKEVYDWAVSLEGVPLHFTIQSGDTTMMRDAPMSDHCAHSEVKLVSVINHWSFQ